MNQVQQLSKLISIQTGSVVSQELIKQSGGTITLFAFDQDQGLSEHTAPYAAFIFALEGTADVTLSGLTHTLTSGQSLLMPANSPHSLKATTPFKMLLVMIKS